MKKYLKEKLELIIKSAFVSWYVNLVELPFFADMKEFQKVDSLSLENTLLLSSLHAG